MSTIELEVKINQNVYVELHINEIVSSINDLPVLERINYIGLFLNNIDDEGFKSINSEQKQIIKNYLEKKLTQINKNL
jgi:hypothetical protein